MKTPEQRLSARTGSNLRSRGIYAERIENYVGAGTPDLLCASGKLVTFIEHKVVEWPKKAATRVQFLHAPTPDQINWHLQWTQAGRRSLFLISNGTGPGARVFAVPGDYADDVLSFDRRMLECRFVTYDLLAKYLKGKASIT